MDLTSILQAVGTYGVAIVISIYLVYWITKSLNGRMLKILDKQNKILDKQDMILDKIDFLLDFIVKNNKGGACSNERSEKR